MERLPSSPHLATPAELKERIEAERAGGAFIVLRDDAGAQRIVPLGAIEDSATIGREEGSTVRLDWDEHVSSLHAELRRVGGQWLVVDDGLSRNGTHVNGERVAGRRRLQDRDQLAVGETMLIFRDPSVRRTKSTVVVDDGASFPELSPAQRRVLVALCRPFGEGANFARPATNQQIADELFLTVPAVKTHLRALFQGFGVENLPQNEKRARLVHVALDGGAVSPADIDPAG